MNGKIGLLIGLFISTQIFLYESTPQLFVPFYLHTTKDSPAVQQLALASKSLSVVAVINPNNGPTDGQPDVNITSSVETLLGAGILLLGYTASLYGTRDLNEVISDVNKYSGWKPEYKLNGIFLDQASAELDKIDYYKQIYNYTRKQFGCKSKTFTGVGTNVDEVFFGDDKNRTADTIVIFEDDYDNWVNFKFSSYTKSRAESELCAIIHSCPKENMKDAVDIAVNNNIGFIYVTDRQMNNPFDALPTYFEDLILYMTSK
jgi:hypothetical protein